MGTNFRRAGFIGSFQKLGCPDHEFSYGRRRWENSDSYLFAFELDNVYPKDEYFTIAYRVNKKRYDIEFAGKIPVYQLPHSSYTCTVWAAVPELVEQFHIPDSETNSQYLPMVRTNTENYYCTGLNMEGQ